MKKDLIALVLSLVMAAGSAVGVSVWAAETTASEAMTEEEAAEGTTNADETEMADEAATDENDSMESVQDQSIESESEALDEEPETIVEDDNEESSNQNVLNTTGMESQEAELEIAPENGLTADQIWAFQNKIKIWKYDNQITLVYDSTEDISVSYRLYSAEEDELLYEGNLYRNDENGLYYETVDFDAVNEAENGETNEIDIADISVKAVIEVITDQDDEDFDSNVNSFEEIVSDDTRTVSITEVDTGADGKITAKWDRTGSNEIDGYSVIVRGRDGNDSILVYDTERLTDNEDADAYTLNADNQITLNIAKESVSDITVAAYKFDGDSGVKHYGKAAHRVITEDENQVEEADSETVSKDATKGVIASGTVGEALNWAVFEDGRLIISGTWDEDDTERPWLDYSFNKIIIESGITRIGDSAFWDCSEVTSVIIPNTVKTIGSQAFHGCKNLTELTIPSSVTEIGSWAFFDCTNLTSVTFTGAGENAGGGSTSPAIEPKSVSLLAISGISDKTYTGQAQTQAIVVKDGDVTLTEGTDYDVAYADNINAGTASVVITGRGNYEGTVTKTFTIKKASNTITATSFTKTYSTVAQTFSLGVKIKSGTPTYKSSTSSVTVSEAGKATVKAKFIGKATITITSPETANYSKQTKNITITVNPTKTTLLSVTSPSAGKMTVKWEKNTVGTGYQIQFSTSSKFEKVTSVTITDNTMTTRSVGSLIKGKKYYVRIRTYKTVGGNKFCSGWSAVKTVTIKS